MSRGRRRRVQRSSAEFTASLRDALVHRPIMVHPWRGRPAGPTTRTRPDLGAPHAEVFFVCAPAPGFARLPPASSCRGVKFPCARNDHQTLHIVAAVLRGGRTTRLLTRRVPPAQKQSTGETGPLVFSDQTGRQHSPSPQPPSRPCPRCGDALRAAMHLPERLGEPAYDIFCCFGCGFLSWVAQGTQL